MFSVTKADCAVVLVWDESKLVYVAGFPDSKGAARAIQNNSIVSYVEGMRPIINGPRLTTEIFVRV